MKDTINNNQLGNFGFLLDYGQEFLFELGQQAESYLYTNLRLSAVFIRQLTEAFFDIVIDDFKINSRTSAPDEPTIFDKQKAICFYFRSHFDPYYRTYVFPVFPGSPGDGQTRVRCPEGEGGNSFGGANRTLVDPEKKTIFVWDAIRRVGNAGSHAVLTAHNQKWLEARYVEMAVKELCNRMNHYFFQKHNPVHAYRLHTYRPENACYGTGQILYGYSAPRRYMKNGILPACTEHLCVSVVPEPEPGANGRFQNSRNRFALVRSYERTDGESAAELDHFLIQSQRVYLKMQQHGNIPGISEFSVLADLRSKQKRYVSAYVFNEKPECIDYNVLSDLGIYQDISRLVRLFLGILAPLEKMCQLGIYHRTFTHQSIRLLRMPDEEFVPYIIDFETCKLFEEGTSRTIYQYAVAEISDIEDGKYCPHRAELKQYNGFVWDEHTTPEQYRKEVIRRMAGVFMNILCPEHLNKISDGPADKKDLFDGYNWIDDYLKKSEMFRRGVEELADILTQAGNGVLDFPSIREKLEVLV